VVGMDACDCDAFTFNYLSSDLPDLAVELILKCPSSDGLGQSRGFVIGGSGSSLIEFMRFRFCGASAV
jgi:hypothetical protein